MKPPRTKEPEMTKTTATTDAATINAMINADPFGVYCSAGAVSSGDADFGRVVDVDIDADRIEVAWENSQVRTWIAIEDATIHTDYRAAERATW